MITFKQNLLGKKLLDEIFKSYEQDKKRNLVKDCQKFLKLAHISYSLSFDQNIIPNKPTIVVANHYARPILVRKSLLSTIDSMITSSIITVGLSRISNSKITWVVKDNLLKNILFYNFKQRKTQMAAISVYDFIGVSNNYPFSKKNIWLQRLNSGYNLALYPEGEISTKLKNPRPGLDEFISFLSQNNIDLRLLPVGIYFKNGFYYANFGKSLKIEPTDHIESITMHKIAEKLPANLRGSYNDLSIT